MEQFFEFANNHLILVTSFIVLLVLFLWTESRKGGQGISSSQATQLLNKEGAVVVDLRSKPEYKEGHIIDAINLPYSSLGSKISELEKFRAKPIILVCKIGQHSKAAYKELVKAGFEDVRRLNGGMAEWQGANLPLVKN